MGRGIRIKVPRLSPGRGLVCPSLSYIAGSKRKRAQAITKKPRVAFWLTPPTCVSGINARGPSPIELQGLEKRAGYPHVEQPAAMRRILIIRAVDELRPSRLRRWSGQSAPETEVKGSTRIVTPIVLVVLPLAFTPFVLAPFAPAPFPIPPFFDTSVSPIPISPITVFPLAVISVVPVPVVLIVLISPAVVAVLS
jgi:hypothetical protein